MDIEVITPELILNSVKDDNRKKLMKQYLIDAASSTKERRVYELKEDPKPEPVTFLHDGIDDKTEEEWRKLIYPITPKTELDGVNKSEPIELYSTNKHQYWNN